jgi:Epoxide hydrolase N terminus
VNATATDTSIQPFQVDIPQSDLDDLIDRLARVRWPDEPAGAGWTHGVPLDFVRELADHCSLLPVELGLLAPRLDLTGAPMTFLVVCQSLPRTDP